MEPMTTLHEVPSLADCDVELWTDYLGDYISVWLRNSPQFIQDQKQKMLAMALCPFLFGVPYNVPEVWLEVLRAYSVIERERSCMTTSLNEVELEILEMAETIFTRCSQLMENKNDLKTILNFIYDVEERSAFITRIDMNFALQEVVGLEVFASMWAPIKRIYEKRKRQAHVCIIYYFKIISHHLILYGRDGIDKANYVKRLLSDLNRAGREGSVTAVEGNKAFNVRDFKLAAQRYSSVIETEPLNSLLYSNRAQAYLNYSDFRSALCDSKRAIVLDPNNSKHYFRAAKSYLELGQLDKAEETNHQSLDCCTDPLQREAILQQSQDIRAKNRMTKSKQNEVSSGSEEREIDNAQVQFRRFLFEGSNLYLSNLYSRAMEQFKSALSVLARPDIEEGLTSQEDDLLVVWFVYGLSCVKTANIRNLQTAIEKFNAIISRTDKFPASYYGLGLAYIALKRYKEAAEVLKTGQDRTREFKNCPVYFWPQTNKVIEETHISTLEKLMEDAMRECMYPPKPDAVCKFHTDADNSKREIYMSDPDYKGHICIKCRADCSVEFHVQCWKIDNHNRGKHNWKEMLDTPCPTPGCWGNISEIFIYRTDQEKSLKLTSQMDPKPRPSQPQPKLKMKTESTSKLEKKMEKKKLRKEKREEAHINQELVDVVEQPQNIAAKLFQPQTDNEVANRNIDMTGTLLVKDEPEVLVEKKPKASKLKKKEKKAKQFLALDVQFKGDEDKQRYGVHSLDDDGEFVTSQPAFMNPEPLPTPGSAPTDRSQLVHLTDMDIALYDFFYKFLIAKGPMDLLGPEFEEHTKHLSEEAQTRIHYYGGLISFLSVNPKFTVVQNSIVRAIIPTQQGVSSWRTHGNPWEMKQNKPQETQLYGFNYLHNLNPGAKEFVPQEISTSEAFPEDNIDDQSSLAGSAAAKPAFDELPVPARDNDDGFITVVNKKRLHVHSAAQLDTNKYVPRPAWSYNTLDEIRMEAQPSTTVQPSAAKFIDEFNMEREDMSRTLTAARSTQEVNMEGEDMSRTLTPARTTQEVNMEREDMSRTLTAARTIQEVNMEGEDMSRTLTPARTTQEVNMEGEDMSRTLTPARTTQEVNMEGEDMSRTLTPARTTQEVNMEGEDMSRTLTPARTTQEVNMEGEDMSRTLTPTRSTHDSCNNHGEKQPDVAPPVTLAGHASDVLWEDVLRVSSPSLSTNSGSSSGKADGSQNSSQTSGQPSALRPLKVPAIVLPSRGKKKKLLGHISAKLHSRQRHPSTDGNPIYDGCEEESVSSTTSDKDSSCGDVRLVTDRLSTVNTSSDQFRYSSFVTGNDRHHSELKNHEPFANTDQDNFMFAHHDKSTFDDLHRDFAAAFPGRAEGSNKEIPRSVLNRAEGSDSVILGSAVDGLLGSDGVFSSLSGRTVCFNKFFPSNISGRTVGSDEGIPSSQGSDTIFSVKKDKTCSEERADEKPPQIWRHYKNIELTSGYTSDTQEDISGHSSLTSVTPPLQPPVQHPQSRVLNQVAANKAAVEAKTLADVAWPSWDPWLDRDDHSTIPSVQEDFTRKGLVEHNLLSSSGRAPESTHMQYKHRQNHFFQPSQPSNDFGHVGSRHEKQDDPWFTTPEPQLLHGSPPSPIRDVTNDRTSHYLSPFQAWVHAPDFPASTDYLPHILSTKIPQDPSVQSARTDSIKTEIRNVPKVARFLNLRDRSGSFLPETREDERSSSPWSVTDTDFQGPTVEYKSSEIQTNLKGPDIEEMQANLKMLKEVRAAKDIALHEKIQMQETTKNLEKQVNRDKAVTDKLKQDIKKLVTRLQTMEASAEKRKGGTDQLVQDKRNLQVQNEALADEAHMLRNQLETERRTFFTAQMEILELKKIISTDRIDLKRQEAVQHLQRLTSVITQAGAAAKGLPQSVFTKRHEFSDYITLCDNLKRQVTINAQALRQDLNQGLIVNMSAIEVIPPEFPKPPSQLTDRSQVPSNSGLETNLLNEQPVNPICPEPQNKVPSVPTKSSAQSEETDDEDSIAYLSMFCGGVLDPSGFSSKLQEDAASGTDNWHEDVDERNQDLFYAKAQMPAPDSSPRFQPQMSASDASLRFQPQMSASDALRRQAHVAPRAPSPARVLQGLPRLPGQRWTTYQEETTPTPIIKPREQQHPLAHGPPMSQEKMQQKSYFERIVETVQENLPGYSRNDIQRIMETLKQNSGGTLSKWTFETLTNRILDIILDLEQGEDLASFTDVSASEHVSNSRSRPDPSDFLCSICQSNIEPLEALALTCGHKFHESCVHKWLKNDRTCPNCRSHALLAQDFPALK